MEKKADIALIGLAVMGQNLILNMSDHGFTVVAHNRTISKIDEFLNGAAKGREDIIGAYSIEEMISLLKRPRKVMLMVKAGDVVDKFIEILLPHLEKGDIIIDGGNSYFKDTIRRTSFLKDKGILFIGTGISGGEEGARHGPSIMPGGNKEAWSFVKDIFQTICAKTPDGVPCCDWVGEDGAGHFVKMVHNGIEYGDMQLICEAYQLMKDGVGLSHDEMHHIFNDWNNGELNSYLIEITSQIMDFKDIDGVPLVEKILDSAGQKGTGKWTGISALDLSTPVTLIMEAVFSRSISALKDKRIKAAEILSGSAEKLIDNKKSFIEDIRKALFASKIVSYAQGYMLMSDAAKEYKWHLNFGGIALMWREGCIIRSAFLNKIKEAFDRKPDLDNLLLDEFFKSVMIDCQTSWRNVVSKAILAGIPVPAMSAGLSFYDSIRCARLPANLLQAQRDYFGAHTYERIDSPRGQFFHTNWTGKGGDASSSSYII